MLNKVLLSSVTIALLNLSGISSVLAENTLTEWVQLAASGSQTESQNAIAALRSQGPRGLQAFLAAHQNELQSNLSGRGVPDSPLRAALDAICQQRDCYASQLYWYTDLEQAKAAAKVSGKPILSLRLLGRLDEELSCANSRFFRVMLYPNAAVSKVLRENFILHWQSVRPAPKVTIDFGDGRRLERTLTGNSIHYILDANGRPIDALPGLYSPKAFLRHLKAAETAAKTANFLTGLERQTFLKQYHQNGINTIQANWEADLTKLGIAMPLPQTAATSPNSPLAETAAPLAATKAMVEIPILSAISLNRQVLQNVTDEVVWGQMADLYVADANLDDQSLRLIRQKNPRLYQEAGGGGMGAAMPLAIRNFQQTIALDTLRNEYLFHSQIHQWFVEDEISDNVDNLNERVYAELFQTPSSDPWLGLFPDDTYTGIENDGLIR